MSSPKVVWSQVENYFLRRGFTIEPRGGEKIIHAPHDGNPQWKRPQVVIGHKCSNKHNARVYPGYLSAIHRAFGVTRNDILKG